MPSYLIYEDGSVDEGSRTIIVGPFKNMTKAYDFQYDQKSGRSEEWNKGPWGWEYVGRIDGVVTEFDITNPIDLLNQYPREQELIDSVTSLAHHIGNMYGVEVPEWVGRLKVPDPPTESQKMINLVTQHAMVELARDLAARPPLAGLFIGPGVPIRDVLKIKLPEPVDNPEP